MSQPPHAAGSGRLAPRRARREAGKMGLVELVVWDIVLVGVVFGLAYFNVQLEGGGLEARGGETSADPRASATPQGTPAATPSAGTPAPVARPSEPPQQDPSARLRQQLDALRAQAQQQEKLKRPDLALAAYEQAPAELTGSSVWKEFWPGEARRLQGLLAERDRYLCLRPAVQLAADLGEKDRVQALLAQVPATHRPNLAGEPAWAEAHQGSSSSGGLQLTGFSPDQVRLEGRRCVIDCALGRSTAQTLRSELDTITKLAEGICKGALEGRLELRIVDSNSAAESGGGNKVALQQRPDEGLEALTERARLAAARWCRQQLLGAGGESWLRKAFVDLLVSARPVPGTARPLLTAQGQARRRLFLGDRPDGSGQAVLALLDGRPPDDPAGARGWALLHFAIFSTHPAAFDLRTTLGAMLREGRARGELAPTAAVGVEEAWVAYLERG